MTRRLLAAAVLGAAAGYLARSQLSRRVRLRRALQPHGRLLRDAALIAAQIQPGERYESLSVAVRGEDGGGRSGASGGRTTRPGPGHRMTYPMT